MAPITTTRYGVLSEVAVGLADGLDHASVINRDDVTTVEAEDVLEHIGFLSVADEQRLLAALLTAYDFRLPPRQTGRPVAQL